MRHLFFLVLWFLASPAFQAASGGTGNGVFTVDILSAPTLSAPTASSITAATATIGGNVTSDGGASIIERGVVYASVVTNADPLINGLGVTKVAAAAGTGIFTTEVVGLTRGTVYSYKAYSINSAGTSYSIVGTFTAADQGSTAGDLDAGFKPTLPFGQGSSFALQPDGKVLIVGRSGVIVRVNSDGSADKGFNPYPVGGDISCVALQADGKVLIGGDFTVVYGASRNRIARLNVDGSLDVGFNPNVNGSVYSLAVQADGKVLIGGNFTTVGGVVRKYAARLNTNGSLDTGFNPNPSHWLWSIVVQADNKVLIGGWFSSVNGVTRRIARLNADGSLDTNFNPDDSKSVVLSLAVQADGKVLVGGSRTVSGVSIARLNEDGSLDTGFNPNANGSVWSLALQADGKVLIGGDFTTVSGVFRNRIARLNADGSLDTGFNPNVNNNQVSHIAVQEDGKVLIGGNFFEVGGVSRKYIARLVNDFATQSLTLSDSTRVLWRRSGAAPEVGGVVFEQSLDNGATWSLLGAGVRVGGTADWERTGLSIGSGAKVRATGRTTGGRGNGSSGLIRQAFPMTSAEVGFALSATPTTGSTSAGGSSVMTLGGFITSDGGGLIERGFVYSLSTINAMPEIDGTGVTKLAVSGTELGSFSVVAAGLVPMTSYSYRSYAANSAGTSYSAVGTFTTASFGTVTGDLDSGFNPDANSLVSNIAVQADGRVLIVGEFTTVGGVTRNRIARLNADGSLDTGYNPDVNGSIISLAVQSDGKVLIGGDFTAVGGVARKFLARLNSDGSLDTGFNPDANASVTCFAVQSDGKVLIGGWFTSVDDVTRRYFARLDTNGDLDSGFNPNARGTVLSIALQTNGKVLVGMLVGNANPVGGVVSKQVARFNADGSLDTSFTNTFISDPFNTRYSIAVQADGKVLVGGWFTSVNGVARNGIVRLNSDGSLDVGFNPNLSGSVYSLAVQADGKVLIGGAFSAVGGVRRNYLARLNTDGSLDAGCNPDASWSVTSIAVQADGKVLIGGDFSKVGGVTRKYIARLVNDFATQSLTLTDSTRVQWRRSGAAPEVGGVVFEQSLDNGATWSLLGAGVRVGVTADWERTGLSVGSGAKVRATGRSTGGENNGSSGLIRQAFPITLAEVGFELSATPTTGSTSGGGTSAMALSGFITSDGGGLIERGFVYSLRTIDAMPEIDGAGVTKLAASGTELGSFSAVAAGLVPTTTYSYRSYAANSAGIVYSAVGTFTTLSANADLSSLNFSGGGLNPAFASAISSYTASVSNTTDLITFTPMSAEASVTIEARINLGTYRAINSNSPSISFNLNEGANTFECRVTAQGGNIKIYTVTITRMSPAPPLFTRQPENLLVSLGSEAVLGALIAGDVPMVFQWRKGTKAISSAASSNYSIPLVKASDVAAYSLVANNGVGTPQTSDTAYLGVVSPLQGTQVIKVGGRLSLACTALAPKLPGVTLSYAWKRGVVFLTNGSQPSGAVVAGADKAALAITKLTPAESGSYTCVVTMSTPGNDPVLTVGEALVKVVDAVPVVDAIPLPARLAVSQPVDVFITATNSPTSFSASGLPAGLKLDAKSGRLTGRPTAPSKKDLLGAYIPGKLSFKAANPLGPSAARDWNLVIEPFDPQAMGTFHGIVARDGHSNFHMGGQVQLTVASTGVVSGSATLAGQKHTIVGALDTSLNADPSANLLIKRSPASLGDLRLQINLNPDDNKLTGSITDPRFIMRPGSLELGTPTEQGLVNGTMEEARFSGPRGVVLNSAGNGYIADTGHHVIRFVDAANNVVSTFAGSGSSGSADGTGTSAVFNSPEGLALDASGNIYVADSGNATIRRISPAGVVTTFAGSAGQVGTVNGTGSAARFNEPCALCLDPMGNLYVVDRGSHTIRKITTLGVVTTLAGKADTAGHKDASGISAMFNSPSGITYDPLLKALFVVDTNNFVIRRITLAGATTTYAGSPGVAGSNEGLRANARFLAPSGIISLGDGTLVVADTLLVQINANGTCGIISDYVDVVNRNDHPVALALNPTDRSLIAAHDTLHAFAGHGANGQSAPSADFVAWRNVWSSTRQVPIANQGLYNAALQNTAPTNDLSIPQGHGYSQLSISKSGGAKWTGKSADGSTLTFSTILAENDSIPLHVMLYGNTGSIQGVTKIHFVTGDLTHHEEHVLDWCKIPQPFVSKGQNYKAGFMTTLETKGGRYTPNDLHGFLGLSGSSVGMRLSFMQSPTETFEQPFTLMDPNGVVVTSNNKSLSLKMHPKTGIFTGSYKEGNLALTVNYAGILLNHQATTEKRGLGHFLKAESSSPTSRIWSAPLVLDKVAP